MADTNPDEDLSLSVDTLAALRAVLGQNGAAGDDANGEMDALSAAIFGRRHVEDSSSDEEEEEQVEAVNHAEYYRKLFPERYAAEDNQGKKVIENPRALLTMEDEYVQELLLRTFDRRPNWTVSTKVPEEGDTEEYHFHWGEYEHIEWYSPKFEAEDILVSCYYNRKGLIRKGNLAHILEKWQTKHKGTRDTFAPKSYIITLPPLESGETEDEFQKHFNQAVEKSQFPGFNRECNPDSRDHKEGNSWILKPSVTNQAKGICLVQSARQLGDAIRDADEMQRAGDFVLQQYIEPLLLNGTKFHLRVFMLLHGNLTAYVAPDFLALFSLEPYKGASLDNTQAHLTNIAHQRVLTKEDEYKCMRKLSETNHDMVNSGLVKDLTEADERIAQIQDRVYKVIAEMMEAVSSELTFQSRNNCFELFGIDLMIDPDWKVWLLEANAEPDLSKAGDRLQCVIDKILEDTLTTVVDQNPQFAGCAREGEDGAGNQFVKVFQVSNRGF
uniref:Tubulin-tyrosine ligase n=1 Tax=Mucochytrium quahogii TaxID=96639 RepID=A0A7S2R7U3_9STRA|mmetsp:Transcript_17421/g.29769  ORF Transcript_17421/g.29769 Transcript_17421/m.29769 type:complete len:498 (-) Transcript_17421:961-2454(-)|eukprot:CAMPEP_0203743698 /NCGR_PEP_ID=MMETSP0098-20131031/22_1 /ASSEMBLY_ACC=CAM_ASM_000208 /TAXON_ID=96639 /ORGANISM=" , Strain NY0313808BC1" /LENGTH=497 /DNA_ID=CAMNT_0050631013 /DNA_START=325 /DNA_END=1818 /DNA_ORIENTATION=-